MKKRTKTAPPLLFVMALFMLTPISSSAEPVGWTNNFSQNPSWSIDQPGTWHDFFNRLNLNLDVTSSTETTFAPEEITIDDLQTVHEFTYISYSQTPDDLSPEGCTWYAGIGYNTPSILPSALLVGFRTHF